MQEISKDFPIPKTITRGAPSKHPFAKMDVGDSVLVTEDAKKMQVYCHVYGRQAGKKFTTRKQPCGGVRIWRVE